MCVQVLKKSIVIMLCLVCLSNRTWKYLMCLLLRAWALRPNMGKSPYRQNEWLLNFAKLETLTLEALSYVSCAHIMHSKNI